MAFSDSTKDCRGDRSETEQINSVVNGTKQLNKMVLNK